jgi:hypothetical protein
MTRSAINLFIDPPSYHFERDRLFDPEGSPYSSDRMTEPYIHLRRVLAEQGVATHTADLLDSSEASPAGTTLYVSTGSQKRYRALARRGDVVLSAFFAFECPIVAPEVYRRAHRASRFFKRMYSFSSEEALGPFLHGPVGFLPCRLPQPFDSVHEQAWRRRERGFLVMVNANKVPRLETDELYTERLRAIEFFNRRGEIDLYGYGWDGPAYRVGESRLPLGLRRLVFRAESAWRRRFSDRDPLRTAARQAWRGAAASKAETLSAYRFALAFENSALEGWVTEKIFDCFLAGTVPVYRGAPDIERWVPAECFVDARRFSGYAELREFLLGLAPREIEEYRRAGRDYIASERFYPFSKQSFARLLSEIVAEDAGKAG